MWFSKMPVSSILVLGVSIPPHQHGHRRGRPSYVFVLVHSIRPRYGRGTAQPPTLAAPEAAGPGLAGPGFPSNKRHYRCASKKTIRIDTFLAGALQLIENGADFCSVSAHSAIGIDSLVS